MRTCNSHSHPTLPTRFSFASVTPKPSSQLQLVPGSLHARPETLVIAALLWSDGISFFSSFLVFLSDLYLEVFLGRQGTAHTFCDTFSVALILCF